MRTDHIVFVFPLADHRFCLLDASEPVHVKTFIPELSIEAFNETVLLGFSGIVGTIEIIWTIGFMPVYTVTGHIIQGVIGFVGFYGGVCTLLPNANIILKPRKDDFSKRPYIVKSFVPRSLLNHSLASPSSVANVMYQKYVNAMPLHRQEKAFKDIGIDLPRATLANWVIRCAEDHLDPILKRLTAELVSRDIIHADETPVQVLKEDGKKPESKSYMWLYRTGNDGKAPIVLYDYSPSRNGDNAFAFLGEEYSGYLQCDGYSGYNKLKHAVRCGCWAHVRRKFVEAIPVKRSAGDAKGAAEIGRDLCNAIFNMESSFAGLSPDEIYAKRQEDKYQKTLTEFWNWLDTVHPLPGSKLNTAVDYAYKQKLYLGNHLLDGRLSMSNNIAENSIRPFTVGRKNWLFSDTVKGAKASACVYSIIETAKANGLNTYKYLEYVLREMPDSDWMRHPENLDRLMPWSDEAKALCSKDPVSN